MYKWMLYKITTVSLQWEGTKNRSQSGFLGKVGGSETWQTSEIETFEFGRLRDMLACFFYFPFIKEGWLLSICYVFGKNIQGV